MKSQFKKLFVVTIVLLAFGLLSFGHVNAEETNGIRFDFGENNVQLSDSLSIKVVNDRETTTLQISETGNEIYEKNLSFVQVTGFHQVDIEDETYGVITYRHHGSANALYFEVINLNSSQVEVVYTSDVFERATIEMIEDKITIEYADYAENDSMANPSAIIKQDFVIKENTVETGEAEKIALEKGKSTGQLQSKKKTYVNPSFAEINKMLTEKAIEADIPPEVLKAIAYQESRWRQYWTWDEFPESRKSCKAAGNRTIDWDGSNVVIGFDCIGIGIMQISDHIFMPAGKAKDQYIQRLKDDIEFNIDEGIKILKGKWNLSKSGRIPKINDNNPMVLENWYFAIMAYNGLSKRNDPNPDVNSYMPFQELVFNHIRKFSEVDVTPFPTQILDIYYPNNGNIIHFRSDKYQINGPFHYSGQSLKSGKVAYTNVNEGAELKNGYGEKAKVKTILPKGTKVTITGNYRTHSTYKQHYLMFPVKTSTGDTGWISSGDLNLKEYTGVYNLSGKDRFETSVAISKHGWNKSDAVVIGRGDLPIDALTGSVLASGLDSPLLLTRNDRLTPAVKDEILRLRPSQIYILGGEGAISLDIENTLKSLYKGVKVERLRENDRYGTAKEVAQKIASKYNVKEVFITTGSEKSSDPLSIAPYAGEKNIPILLTQNNKLSEAAKAFINENGVSKVTIIGGDTAVSASVENELNKLVGSANVDRVSGKSRFDTTTAIINKYYNLGKLDNIFVAQGMDIADALSAAPLAAKQQSPLVLTLSDNVPDSVQSWLKSKVKTNPDLYFLGGSGAIANNVRSHMINLVR
ncbi:cell wall-binding repeat-containing protein [Oceanobacillus luteolus]|uniref:cell wall-binding repeat-containing protein n=1 Tax=Oceanobacillus luteolus TaxID=1274358 RepID=UPI00203D2286|nr:cell wall-binding repeat-containing protein [Oceanobacillus luteolus]MCM3742047.1 cell wall-binding repeat-containing protein [Oceanobacillus luteolus]